MTEQEKSSGIKTIDPTPKEAKGVAIDLMEKNTDPFLVEGGREDMEYYWGPSQGARQEQEKFRRGFEVVTGTTDPKVRTVGRKSDGTHQLGDAVLMRRPKELGEAERRRNEDISRAHRKMPRRELEELAHQQGVKIINEEE